MTDIEILADVKSLVDVTDKDNILNIYIRRATGLIKNYLNNSTYDETYIKDNFADAVIQLVVDAFNLKDNENVKQMTQASRQVTFKDNCGMNINSVKDLLPLPFAVLR